MEYLLNWGYFGLFIGSFLASTILPLSSEIFVTGMLAAGANPVYVLITATVGNWGGSLSTYWLGWLGKWERIEKWLKIKPEKLEKQKKRIDKYGSALAFLAWLPIVGDLFALGLGFYKIEPKKCIVFMLIGKFCRFLTYILIFMYAGKWFGWDI